MGQPRGQRLPDEARKALETALDEVFARARAVAPVIYAEKMPSEIRQKERFAVAVPFLAAAMAAQAMPEQRQALVEMFITRLDIGMREAGVGDIGVSHRIRAMAGATNGRVQRYVPLLVAGDRGGLLTALQEHGVPEAAAMADALLPEPVTRV